MQTEVPMLPVVCSDGHKRFTRKLSSEPRISPVTIKNHSTCKSAAFLLSKRKQLHPLLGGPYRSTARVYTLSEPVKLTDKNPVGQRIMSAKMLRVKQLQNQLADAHYHLNELANENRLLKALQKRQDSALKRYEGTNAELPRIINSHHEELKVLQIKYKKLKAQHKDTCDLLKEKESELHTLQVQNKHLLQLSKDRNLGEREKLQMQVSDLNHRVKQQQENIQTLNRKLTLESKSLKHQLNLEVSKHKETQRHLQKAMDKLKALEELLDNREKRLYYSGHLPVFGRGKSMGSQSLTNLGDGSIASNLLKPSSRSKEALSHESLHQTLPMLTESEPIDPPKLGKTVLNQSTASLPESPKTETMTSLQQVRKFRLQKSPNNRNLSAREKFRERKREAEVEPEDTVEMTSEREPQNPYELREQRNLSAYEKDLNKFEQRLDRRISGSAHKFPKQLKKDFGSSASESESEDEEEQLTGREGYGVMDPTSKSKELHARLTTKLSDHADAKDVKHMKSPRLFAEDELERFVIEKLKLKRESSSKEFIGKSISKTVSKVELHRIKVDAGISDSDSETNSGSEMNKEQKMYDFVLKNAPDDSEKDDANHPMEDFLKFEVNVSDSGSETDKPSAAVKSSQEHENNLKAKLTRNSGMVARSTKDGYDDGQQRLMDIAKSWGELQEKIMKERESSENQIKALENELEADVLLEKRRTEPELDVDDVKKLLKNIKSPLTGKDDLRECMEEKLREIDNQSKKNYHLCRSSNAQESSNYKTDNNTSLEKNECASEKLQSKQVGSSDLDSEIIAADKSDSSFVEKSLLAMRSEHDDKFLNNVESELSQIDLTQEKLKHLAMENKEQMKEGYKLHVSTDLRDTINIRPENFQKFLDNNEQEPELPKKDKLANTENTYKEEMSREAKMINYNKEKLLAAMKAIDNNENLEILDPQKSRRSSGSNRSQITENLYRGLPTHTKKKDELMKELFGDGKTDSKMRNGCTKLH